MKRHFRRPRKKYEGKIPPIVLEEVLSLNNPYSCIVVGSVDSK